METENIDDSVLDADYLDTASIEVNPDLFIRNTILKAEEALTKDNVEQGFLQYWRLVEHLETLATSANRLPTGYEDNIKAFKDTLTQDSSKDIIKNVKVSEYKFKLLLSEIFKAKVNKEPLPMANPEK